MPAVVRVRGWRLRGEAAGRTAAEGACPEPGEGLLAVPQGVGREECLQCGRQAECRRAAIAGEALLCGGQGCGGPGSPGGPGVPAGAARKPLRAGTTRARVLGCVAAAGEATALEVAAATGLTVDNVRCVLNDLMGLGWVAKVPRDRKVRWRAI